MQEVVTFTAINVRDLCNLKTLVGEVLRAVNKLPVSNGSVLIEFCITGKALEILVPNQCAGKPEELLEFLAPKGVADEDWLELIGLEIENHLLSCGRFIEIERQVDGVRCNPFSFLTFQQAQT